MSAPDLRDPVGRVRLMGMVEACSFLVLLGFSVLKRLPAAGPEWNQFGKSGVLVVGMTHGVLLMIFLLTLFTAWGAKALSGKQCGMAFLFSLLPFGPFIIDRKLAGAESTAATPRDAAD